MTNTVACVWKNPLSVWKKVRSGVAYNPTRLCAMLVANLSGGDSK